MTAAAVIVAGGRGVRMGGDIPKQFMELGGKPILARTLEPFLTCAEVREIVVVAHGDHIGATQKIVSAFAFGKPVRVTKGGSERQESVRLGIMTLAGGHDIVVIHDAVRPFITEGLITSCIAEAAQSGAVTVARPLKETIKSVESGIVTGTPDRSRFWIVQTPQAFHYGLIVRAHEHALSEGFLGTDDCVLVERLGHMVRIIEGRDINIKITTPADFAAAGAILSLMEHGENTC